ncbi:hypothetical protein UNDYM_0074 [Undibacterium sp. YM2]|uniref:hypothetical protein n=1 Tax=Undibacterium sp. YM2 TaxID=2058625 RepID=UPI001331E2E1|nr:hypothetical protein [Undibacterium sp. YM2]BBB64327.1 hypothetical protein UNDYM_0074 [Undibacterium sp. YM2]
MKVVERALDNLTLNKADNYVTQNHPIQDEKIRVLTDRELLSVTGGPEVQVGTGQD